jgi:hypothetical protein
MEVNNKFHTPKSFTPETKGHCNLAGPVWSYGEAKKSLSEVEWTFFFLFVVIVRKFQGFENDLDL